MSLPSSRISCHMGRHATWWLCSLAVLLSCTVPHALVSPPIAHRPEDSKTRMMISELLSYTFALALFVDAPPTQCHLQGGGAHYPYPKQVWSPAGGWWCNPRYVPHSRSSSFDSQLTRICVVVAEEREREVATQSFITTHTHTLKLAHLNRTSLYVSAHRNWRGNTVMAGIVAVGLCVPVFMYSAANEVKACPCVAPSQAISRSFCCHVVLSTRVMFY